jgi:hypothetical protein
VEHDARLRVGVPADGASLRHVEQVVRRQARVALARQVIGGNVVLQVAVAGPILGG